MVLNHIYHKTEQFQVNKNHPSVKIDCKNMIYRPKYLNGNQALQLFGKTKAHDSEYAGLNVFW